MEYIKSYMDFAVFGVLGLMSLLSVAYAIERSIFYTKYKLDDYLDINEFENDLTKNLTTLSIIGSNAPYVGLLGTVVGIMVTFYDIGTSGSVDTSSVMIGLSLSLKATAAGLLVAIPTLVVYTICLRKVDVGMARFKAKHSEA